MVSQVVFNVHLAAELPEELPHVSHHQLRLFPESEVAAELGGLPVDRPAFRRAGFGRLTTTKLVLDRAGC
jgi:hypothetical protein